MKNLRKNILMKSETQTPAGIKENMIWEFPWIKDMCELGNPVLSFDEKDPKDCYRLVWVMPVKYITSGEVTFICYYPKKRKYYEFLINSSRPIVDNGLKFNSKYGPMFVQEIENEMCLLLNNTVIVVEEHV